MKSYIINAPHLQSLQKRLGSLFAWAIGWLMWAYLLVPLIIFLLDKNSSSWITGQSFIVDGGYTLN